MSATVSATSFTTPRLIACADVPLRVIVYRMAECGITRLPVVERDDPGKLAGMIGLRDLLRAWGRNLQEERSNTASRCCGCTGLCPVAAQCQPPRMTTVVPTSAQFHRN